MSILPLKVNYDTMKSPDPATLRGRTGAGRYCLRTSPIGNTIPMCPKGANIMIRGSIMSVLDAGAILHRFAQSHIAYLDSTIRS